jgi:hypothetical protein
MIMVRRARHVAVCVMVEALVMVGLLVVTVIIVMSRLRWRGLGGMNNIRVKCWEVDASRGGSRLLKCRGRAVLSECRGHVLLLLLICGVKHWSWTSSESM